MTDWITFFEKGFPLESPNVILLWNQPLDELATMSGGVWDKDRYLWKSAIYLNGLNYMLSSKNGIDQKSCFKSISVYVGLTPEGWKDDASMKGYGKVSEHLVRLFGEPHKRTPNPEIKGIEDLVWQFGNTEIYLLIIEQFGARCYLTINNK